MALPIDGTAIIANKPAKVAERADTGTVDPTDYVPTPKEAPIPESDAPGIVSSDKPSRGGRVEVIPEARKPKGANPVKQVVDGVKDVADRVSRAVSSQGNQPTVNRSQLLRDIAAKDDTRMRAVRRYGKKFREAIPTAVEYALIAKGEKATPEKLEAITVKVLGTKIMCGFKVAGKGKGEYEAERYLPFASGLAYMHGSVALTGVEWTARQWIKRPAVADILLTTLAIADVALRALSPEGIIGKAVVEAMESLDNEPIKATARVVEE
jgi:hypothetical protein